ncbi:MAG TPA: hypothetical protein VE782_16275, partial [Myxococcaceae bacterium]|nr:hypothetical protein [Myxococcaceae bacterium]
TSACGPDNENGRGFFGAGTIQGVPWVLIGGARSAGSLKYVYMTPDTSPALAFRYVDINGVTGGATRGFSAAHFFNDRVYLGFPDNGGARPYLSALLATPRVPGLDAVAGVDVLNLRADNMPRIGRGNPNPNPDPTGTLMIDSFTDFNGRLYVANNGGIMRSTTSTPRSYAAFPADWADATPGALWAARPGIPTAKMADLEPADRAVPQMAAFQGRLYVARNTTTGPQLIACAPATTGSTSDCDPGDWQVVAPNTADDRTQFGDSGNNRVTLLVAAPNHLYVGFDNATRGVVVFRTASAAPASRADFQGQAGCDASLFPASCEGLGGNGFSAGMTRLWDAKALSFGGATYVYVSAGTGAGPARLYRIFD